MNEIRPSLSPAGSVPRAETTAKRLRMLMVIVLLSLTFLVPSSATSAQTVKSARCADLLTVLGHTPPDSLGYQRLVDLGAMLGCGQVTDYAALVALYLHTDGDRWLTKTNWRSDTPHCGWYGVDCDMNGRVSVLCLAANQLSGPIPTTLGNLSSLWWLTLSYTDASLCVPAQDLLDFFLGLNFYEGPDLCLPSQPTWAVPIRSC
jgi:hypothetical protein